ncbi:MAG: SHOCT domain-containing protein [Planctomycetota bacterium]
MLAGMPPGTEFLRIFLWFAAVAVLALAGFYIAVAIRRWTQRDEPVENFTLQSLREMRARGELSEQEFTAMRAVLLAQAKAAEDVSTDETGGQPEDRRSPPPDEPGEGDPPGVGPGPQVG